MDLHHDIKSSEPKGPPDQHLPLEPLLALLRKRGFTIKPDDYIEVLKLVRQFGSANLDKTAEWLCPVLCTNPNEQARFYRVVDEYKQLQAAMAPVAAKETESKFRKYWWVFALILGLLAIAALWPGNPKPLSAKMPPLEQAYQTGDTIVLDASAIFFGREEDTAKVQVSWTINYKERLEGLRTYYVVKQPGKLLIRLEMQSEKITLIRSFDSKLVEGCRLLPAIELVAPPSDILVGDTFSIRPDIIRGEQAIAGFEWEYDGKIKRTTAADPALRLSFDTAATYTVYCRVMLKENFTGCMVSEQVDVKISEKDPGYAISVEKAGNTFPPPEITLKPVWNWLLLLPSLLGIMFLIWLKWLKKKPETDLKAETKIPAGEKDTSTLKPVFEIPFDQRDINLVAVEPALRRVYNQLRQKSEEDSTVLNIPATVQAIIKNGGMPDLIFTPRMGFRKYVVAIDRSNPKSMMTSFFEWVARSMQEANIPVAIFHYNADLLFFHKEHPQGISFEQLGVLYHNSTLLIMGNARQFIYRAYPVIEPGVISALDHWESKAILTPVPYPDWDVNEHLLAGHFVVLPADLESFEFLVPAMAEKTRQTEQMLQSQATHWVSLDDYDFKDPVYLRSYLQENQDKETGDILFQWLCSICVYPKLKWEVLVEVGKTIFEKYGRSEKFCFETLLKICRIPWVEAGTFPQRTRLLLLKELETENELLARQTVLKMLEFSKLHFGTGYYFSDELETQQITNEFVLYASLPEKYPSFSQGSHEFETLWEQDEVLDAPLKKYLGPQAKEPWSTPLKQSGHASHMDDWMRRQKEKRNIPPPETKRSWMNFAFGLPASILLFWGLLQWGVFPEETKWIKPLYSEKETPVTINLELITTDSCPQPDIEKVLLVTPSGSFPFTLDTGASVNQNLVTGSLVTNGNNLRSGSTFLQLNTRGGKTVEASIDLPLSNTLKATVSCPPPKTEPTVTDTPAIKDTIPPPDSSKPAGIDKPEESTPEAATLPSGLTEIWVTKGEIMAFDLLAKQQYVQKTRGRGIEQFKIINAFKGPENSTAIIFQNKDGSFKKATLNDWRSGRFMLATCPANLKNETGVQKDVSPCPGALPYSLYYANDTSKIFLPRNGISYANPERNKILKGLPGEQIISTNISRQRRLPATGQQQQQLNMYINTYYYSTMGLRQERYRIIQQNWPGISKSVTQKWTLNTFDGGPFDRDYVEVYQQYIPAPEQVPDNSNSLEPLSERTLLMIAKTAAGEVGTLEEPPGSNQGKRIDNYLLSIGSKPGVPWNAAFVYWCYDRAKASGYLAKTGSALEMWNNIPESQKFSGAEGLKNPSRIKPGNIFFISRNRTTVFCGIILAFDGKSLQTIEGNSNEGVVRRTRNIEEINLGFSDFSATSAYPPAAK